jgi:hypothetical protein
MHYACFPDRRNLAKCARFAARHAAPHAGEDLCHGWRHANQSVSQQPETADASGRDAAGAQLGAMRRPARWPVAAQLPRRTAEEARAKLLTAAPAARARRRCGAATPHSHAGKVRLAWQRGRAGHGAEGELLGAPRSRPRGASPAATAPVRQRAPSSSPSIAQAARMCAAIERSKAEEIPGRRRPLL